MNFAAMQLDQVTHNRQPQAEPVATDRASELPEWLENVWQEIGADAGPRVIDLGLNFRADLLNLY